MNKRIDLTAIDTQITPIIHAVQYDTDRYIDCYFEDIDITGVSSARIYGLKPDGTEVYNDCVINDGYITAPLTSQTLAAVGTVKCQLQLVIDGTLTSFEFSVIVDKSLVSASAIPSSNEYTALEAALAEVEDVIEGLPAKVSKAGDSMSGDLNMNGNGIQNVGSLEVERIVSDVNMSGRKITGLEPLGEDSSFDEAVNKASLENYSVPKGSTVGLGSIAIGVGADARGTNSIQLGTGQNTTQNTFQVGNYQLLDANGKIPNDRLNITEQNFELIQTITADGTRNDYTIPLNNAKDVYIVCNFTVGSATSNVRTIFQNSGSDVSNILLGQINNGAVRYHSIRCRLEGGLWMTGGRIAAANDGINTYQVTADCPPKTISDFSAIDSITIKAVTASVNIPSGSLIYVYAR